MVCGGSAGAFMKAMIEQREKEGWEYRYQEPLSVHNPFFMGGHIEERIPQFSYNIEV